MTLESSIFTKLYYRVLGSSIYTTLQYMELSRNIKTIIHWETVFLINYRALGSSSCTTLQTRGPWQQCLLCYIGRKSMKEGQNPIITAQGLKSISS